MFVLLVAHHLLNSYWIRSVFKGKYNSLRILQTILVIGVFSTMIGSMISGMILSRYALSSLPTRGGQEFGRNLHMLSAYWGFVFMSLHLGFHWGTMMAMAKKITKRPSEIRKWLLRGAGALIAIYSVYAFNYREFGRFMFLQNHFAFFDYTESPLSFFTDYVAIMGLFVWISYYFSVALRQRMRKENSEN